MYKGRLDLLPHRLPVGFVDAAVADHLAELGAAGDGGDDTGEDAEDEGVVGDDGQGGKVGGEGLGEEVGLREHIGDGGVEEVQGPGSGEEGDGEVDRRWMEGFSGSERSVGVRFLLLGTLLGPAGVILGAEAQKWSVIRTSPR